MGTASSSLQPQEGDHFSQIINPSKKAPASGSDSSKSKAVLTGIKLHPKAALLKKIAPGILWNGFLSSTAESFALTQSEAIEIVIEAALATPSTDTTKKDKATVEADVKIFIEFIAELSEKDTSKSIDFMAICSSTLFLSDVSIETKVDQLYEWIVLKENPASFDASFDEFLVAMSSFERGLSHAMGHTACSEAYVRTVATQWIALADPKHKGSADSNTKISNKSFFEFCTNRQHVVRRLLEAFSQAISADTAHCELTEVVDTVNSMAPPASGGDEWMANPAWKKTAERMIPPEVKASAVNVKPSSTLTLEWVHGYRGFDCRNNVYYVDGADSAQLVLYSAAALGIVLDVGADKSAVSSRTQAHFAEHGDDIVSLTMTTTRSTGENLIASGEIGKTPAIYLYRFNKSLNSFQSLACCKGYHTKGVAQLAFNPAGTLLFSVGVDYTVAVYNSDAASPQFGKMVVSAQGPKSKIMHCCAFGGGGGGEGTKESFFSYGEKHLVLWRMERGTLKQETAKISPYRNKFILCGAQLPSHGETAVFSTHEGDLFAVGSGNLTAVPVTFRPPLAATEGHGKNAINALWVSEGGSGSGGSGGGGDLLVTGGKEGSVVVWRVTCSAPGVVSLELVLQFSIYGHSTSSTVPSVVVCGVENQGSAVATAGGAAGGGKKGAGPAGTAGKGSSGGSAASASTKTAATTAATETLPTVRSVCLSASGRKLLVGTSTCEIIEYELPVSNQHGLHRYAPLPAVAAKQQAPFLAHSLVCGHFRDEVWGLAVRPVTARNASEGVEYCTVGDDGYLRFWSLATHTQLRCLNLKGMARAVAYSPDATYLAIGYGGRTGTKNSKNKEDGIVRVFRFDEPSTSSTSDSGGDSGGSARMTQVVDIKDARQWISVVRFSPDGSTLVAGSRDNSVYIYSVNQQFKRRAKFSKHNAGINQLDFTADSKYIQSCCSGYEILFSDALTGAQLTDGATKLSAAPMDTWTCTLGWPVIGIWSGAMDGSDVNGVDRSPSGALVASSDDFGKVNVYRYPAIRDGGNAKSVYHGHSSHVTCVRWASLGMTDAKKRTDDYLISIGGEDKCVFQWRNSEQEGKKMAGLSLEDVDVDVGEGDAAGTSGGGGFDFGAPSGGDEFTAVKPWLGAIVAPTAWATKDASKIHPFYAALGEFSTQHRRFADEAAVNIREAMRSGTFSTGSDAAYGSIYADIAHAADTCRARLYESGVENGLSAPDMDELELEWVHGYRGFDCRNNVFYVESRSNTTTAAASSDGTAQRSVVYFAAALGIVLDPIRRNQRYFKGHSDDIASMAVHKATADTVGVAGDAIVATGQQGPGCIFVWEVPSLKTLASVNTKQKTVHMLAFSCDGRLVVSIAEDKTVAVSDWRSATVLCNTKGEAAVTHSIAASSVPGANLSFLSCGAKHIRFWTLNGRNLTAGKVGTTACKGTAIQQYLCVAELSGNYYMGCEDGSIYVIPGTGKAVNRRFDHHTPDVRSKLGKTGASVTAIRASPARGLLITGAKDGSVVVWSSDQLFPVFSDKAARKAQFSVDRVGASNIMAKQIQSIVLLTLPEGTYNHDELVFAIGTRGCDILEVCVTISTGTATLYSGGGGSNSTTTADRVLVRSHCNDELWGVATHPTRPEYCSVGDDKTLRFFNVHTKAMTHTVPLGNIARAVCYNTDGSLLAVGFGGRVGRGKETGGGVVRLYSVSTAADGAMTVSKVAERQDAKQWISDVKFSADSSTLAVAAHDCKIYIYDVRASEPHGLKLRSTFAKHNSVVNHIDLSADGRYMQSNCSAYELLFCDTTTGRQVTSATELRDVKWHTWTCTLGWPVQGIWSAGMDGSDINAVSRSHSGHLLATSDDFGKVNVFRYPCLTVGAVPLKYTGHSSHVMNVRWTAGDECLISCGGNDKCLMQWRHVIADVTSAGLKSPVNSGGTKAGSGGGGADSLASASQDEFGGALFDSGPGGGDESGAVKPWLGAIRAPKNPPVISPQAPAAQLSLSWVHGYTSGTAGANNSRISNNLFYNLEGNAVYPAAALAIELNRAMTGPNNTMTQSFFHGHDDDILCLAMSKDRRYIATGQTASKSSKGKGSIIVWDANSNRVLTRMDGCHGRGVVSLAFSPEGDKLLSVGLDDSSTHILWSDQGGGWSRVQQTATEKGDKNAVLFSRWVHPSNPMAGNGEYHFLSGGGSGVNFWKVAGSTVSKKQGRFGRKYKQCPLLCAANLQGKEGWQMVIGTATGDLYSFAEREVTNSVEKAHNGPVLCLSEGGVDCLFLVSGGRDKCVKVWNTQLQPISNFDCSAYSCCDASIASVDIRPFDMCGVGESPEEAAKSLVLLVGTYGGEIMELTAKEGVNNNSNKRSSSGGGGSSQKMSSGGGGGGGSHGAHEESRNLDVSNATVEVLVHSHFGGELWGVATHPLYSDIIATVGDDSTLRIWSIKQRRMIKCVKLGWPARCVAWHPLGTVLAVGFHESVKGGYKSSSAKGGAAAGKKGKGRKAAPPPPAVAPAPEPKVPGQGYQAVDQAETGTEASGGSGDGNDSGAPEPHKGAVHLYSVRFTAGNSSVEVAKRADGCDSVAWIADIKFSPDGQTLCVGSHDKRLYAYKVPEIVTGDVNEYGAEWADCLKKPLYAFNKHSSAVLHVDFTLDNKYFQTNCQAGELLFGLLADGTHEKSGSKLADYNNGLGDDPESEGRMWATQTCILGWSVQGIWPNANNVQLSDINSADRHVGGKVLATADDQGMVKLFRFPCVQDGSKFKAYGGHSSHVTNVRWNIENHLVSTGGNDKCVFIWEMSEK